ncbi:ankyrin repeat-containing domain protein [Geopyxis carbonaria]|nr:ankyrin repeat-containing domain protein [Geopyxis carbonaria]
MASFASLPAELILEIGTRLSNIPLKNLIATCRKHAAILTLCLLRRALRRDWGFKALLHAARINSPTLTQTLLSLGACPNGKFSPYHLAAKLDHVHVLNVLLCYHSPSLTAPCPDGRDPLTHAAANNSPACVFLLLNYLPINTFWTGAEDAFQLAADSGFDTVVQLFLTHACPDRNSLSRLLFGPARNGWTRTCKLLLAAGADPNSSLSSWLPLHSAAKFGNVGVVYTLLAAGADPDPVSHTQRDLPTTPLLLAARAAARTWVPCEEPKWDPRRWRKPQEMQEEQQRWVQEMQEEERKWADSRRRCEWVMEMLLDAGADMEWALHLSSTMGKGAEIHQAVDLKMREICARVQAKRGCDVAKVNEMVAPMRVGW